MRTFCGLEIDAHAAEGTIAEEQNGMVASKFNVRLDMQGETACMYVEGDLDMSTAGQLNDCVALTLTKSGCRPDRLVVDLGGAVFCDSTGLSALLEARKTCAKQGVGMVLQRPSDRIRRLLTLTGVTDFFTIDSAE